MATLSSITSFAVNDPLSPSHFNTKLDSLVSNIVAVNANTSTTTVTGSDLTGSGATNYLPVWSAVTSLGSSIVSQNGGILGIGGPVSITSILVVNSSNTTATAGTIRLSTGGSIQARLMDGSANAVLISHDSTNNRINVGTNAAGTSNYPTYFNHDMKWITDGTYTIGDETGTRARRMYVTDYYVVGSNVPQSNGAFRANYRDDILVGRNDSNNSDIVMWGVTSSNEIRQGTTLNSRDMVIKAPRLQDYAETVHAFGSISANTVASFTSGNCFTATMTSNVSFQIVNAPATGSGACSFLLTASGSTVTASFLSVNFGAQGNPPGFASGTRIFVNLFTAGDAGLTFIGSYATGY